MDHSKGRVGHFLGWCLAAAYLAPVGWLVLTSFRPARGAILGVHTIFFRPTFEQYRIVLFEKGYLAAIGNSFLIASLSALLATAAGTLASYSCLRWSANVRERLLFAVLTTRMVPAAAMLVPLYLMFQSAGALDTRVGVVAVHATIQLGFTMWVSASYMRQLPERLLDAAALDGHSHLGALVKVVIPILARPIMLIGFFAFLFSWNEYMFSAILGAFEARTLPVGIPGLISHYGTYWEQVAAVGTLSLLPGVLLAASGGRRIARVFSFGLIDVEEPS